MNYSKELAYAYVIQKCKDFFTENFSDEFGYVTEKVTRIEQLNDEDYWVAMNMIHPINRREIWFHLPENVKTHLDKEYMSI